MKPKSSSDSKLERVELSMQEWWAAQRHRIERNRKKYRRKGRDRNDWRDPESDFKNL